MIEIQIHNLVRSVLGTTPAAVTRQTFGHNSITFDVALPERNVIVRTNANPQVFATTERNLAVLRQVGLPVSHVIASDLTLAQFPFAYIIVNKIPGRDLRYELAAMTASEQKHLAEQLVAFQKVVERLPHGRGYGYVGIGEPGDHASWWDIVKPDEWTEIEHGAGTVIGRLQSSIRGRLKEFEPYFRAVPAVCFLDDITVKNVIVSEGELQGLIDFDCVCYGDPLYWLALTAVGVVSDAGESGRHYVEELNRLYGLSNVQKQVLALYSASIGMDFMRRYADTETREWNARMVANIDQWLV